MAAYLFFRLGPSVRCCCWPPVRRSRPLCHPPPISTQRARLVTGRSSGKIAPDLRNSLDAGSAASQWPAAEPGGIFCAEISTFGGTIRRCWSARSMTHRAESGTPWALHTHSAPDRGISWGERDRGLLAVSSTGLAPKARPRSFSSGQPCENLNVCLWRATRLRVEISVDGQGRDFQIVRLFQRQPGAPMRNGVVHLVAPG